MKKEDLIAGETILLQKEFKEFKHLYLGCSDLIHFVSVFNDYKKAFNRSFTIEELEYNFTIEQPQSKVVPLEKKVYDFVPVRVRDFDDDDWQEEEIRLVAVTSNDRNDYPFIVICDNESSQYRYCEFK